MVKDEFLRKLKYFKIPETAYSLEGAYTDHCLYIEKKEATWEVCEAIGSKKRIRGVFARDTYAYDFLFFLIMKRYVPFKKRWWW